MKHIRLVGAILLSTLALAEVARQALVRHTERNRLAEDERQRWPELRQDLHCEGLLELTAA